MTPQSKPSSNFYFLAFLGPRYWGTWLLLGLLKGMASLPFGLQKRVANFLTPLVMRWAKSRLRVCRINLETVFPEWSVEVLAQKLRESFHSFVLGFIESNAGYWMKYSRFSANFPFRIEGLDHLKTAILAGKGVIVCGYHMHILDLSCRTLAEKIERDLKHPVAVVYQAHKNSLVDHFLYRWRRRYASEVFRRKELKKILAWLKIGNVLFYAPDQDFGQAPSVFAPFMGVSTATLTAPARMLQHTGAVLIPACFFRNKGEWVLQLLAPLDHYPSGDEVLDATRLNAVYEPMIRQHPEQYLWQHRRFKTRPLGVASFYE